MIYNVMETLVEDKMKERLAQIECCNCEKCLDDIRAIALNRLPSKYVSTNKGEVFTRISSTERQNTLDIEFAVVSAIEFVASHPHHDEVKDEAK